MQVLIVEDEPMIRLGMAISLEDAGYAIVEAATADDAIAILKRPDHDIRLVVTDVDMPGSMDGLKLACVITDQWPPIRLIVVSGKTGVSAGQLPAGAKFVSKPYREPEFLRLVADLVGPIEMR